MDRNPSVGLVQQATEIGASSAHISDDLASALFPKSNVILSDRMLSNGRQYLRAMVQEIETEICMIAVKDFSMQQDIIIEIGNSGRVHSYTLLQNAGLLNSKTLLDNVFTSIQRAELGARLLQKISQADLEAVLTRYLDDEDASIADAAMALLVTQSRDNIGSGSLQAHISNLSAETLFELTWPITAALQKLSGDEGPELRKAAEKLLGGHDEGIGTQNRAQRLAQLVDQADASEQNLHPIHDGLDLFLARLARRSGLSVDQLILFTAEPNMARLVLTMRAIKLSPDHASSIFSALDGSGHVLTRASYSEIEEAKATELVSSWSTNALYQDAQQRLNVHLSGMPA
ncbi:hypothetical protein [Parasphingorhabdus cellanae]|uniref:DUF2336 domain-containing protein n=1 Tax=Parasphingorhabdus cellanae TaxID=2806553 RepID=A0ABX7T5N2_9SPHN|nr:hypothetical protein [Parasphingorhabdus cellanae]QTD56077.1 hypothetical protein J4G78_00230 [Parasphingorhabdus cellanae]